MQLPLFAGFTETELVACIQRAAGLPVNVILTDNSSTVLSFKQKLTGIVLRLHRMFLQADIMVMDEIGLFINGKKRKTPLLNEFIKSNRDRLKNKKPRSCSIITQGARYDLREIFGHLNSRYFNGRIMCPITWGGQHSRRHVRKRTLGCYSQNNNVIRIHRILDSETIPRYFVEFIVYHEMLHADLGIREHNGRRSVHPREFRMREKEFARYAEASAFEKSHRF